jgi:hypothetical protein
MCYSLSQQPIMGRVFARGVGFADDLNIYASLKTALKVLVEMLQRLGEDAKLSFNMTKVKIYIPGVTRERARELGLQHIERSRTCAPAHRTRDCRANEQRAFGRTHTMQSQGDRKWHTRRRITCLFLLRCIAGHTPELHEVQGITSTRTPRTLSRGETNEASSWSCSAQLTI